MNKFKIERAYHGELESYKEILDKYNATYHIDEKLDWHHYAMIELDSVVNLKQLAKELDQSVIVSEYKDALVIYDDYME